MIEVSRKGEWWYGAGAAFPKAVEWHNWFAFHADRIENMGRRERFVVDATMKLQQTMVKMGQVIRKNLDFTRGYTEGNMADVKALAEESAAWYRRNRPTDETIRGLDPVLVMLYHGLDGAYAIQERLALEIDQITRKGYFLIDTGAESAALSRS